jgi:cytoskeleton protein RodZ
MDLIEIGAVLRESRERKGLSIEEVEEKTKIAPSVIVALEEGNRDRFPHPVYARGFVRSYAMLLGLDAVELCGHFSRAYPVPTDSEPPEHHATQIKVRSRDSQHLVTAVRVVAVLGILALGALGWYVFDAYRSRQVPAQATVPAVEAPAPQAETQVLPPESTPAPLTQMQEVAAEPPQPLAPESVQNGSAPVGAESGEAAPASVPGMEKPAAPEAGSETASAAPVTGDASAPAASEAAPDSRPAAAAERTLRIEASSASWLQARPDDKVLDYFLRKGESTTITFRESLSVKFGNAGGVRLELDGKPYPFEAQLGEVRTLVFD